MSSASVSTGASPVHVRQRSLVKEDLDLMLCIGTTTAPASGTASTTASAVAISTAGAAHLFGQGMGAAGAAVAALAFL